MITARFTSGLLIGLLLGFVLGAVGMFLWADYANDVLAERSRSRLAAAGNGAEPAGADQLDLAPLHLERCDFPFDHATHLRRLDGAPAEPLHGRPLLVHYWATWCAPCFAEMPEIIRLRDTLPERTFVLIAFDDEAEVRQAAERHGWPTDLMYTAAETQVPRSFPVPFTLLVDEHGHTEACQRGAARWDAGALRAALDALQ